MPPFETINYSLRTNKNIERKIIFDGLKSLSPTFGLQDYLYLGFGSIWFVDFALAHRMLGISTLISIEQDEVGFARATFNRPLKCITVEFGESSKVIPQLRLGERPVLAWLDNEKYLFSSPPTVLSDIRQLCEVLSSGSIVIVTVNAHVGQINDYMEKEDKLQSIQAVLKHMNMTDAARLGAISQIMDGTELDILEQRLKAFETAAGNLVPYGLEADSLSLNAFPRTLAKVIIRQFRHSIVASGREVEFIPLFNFYYKDNAPMITVGGMIADESDVKRFEGIDERLPTGEGQVQVNVPPLTVKEKIALDRFLPRDRSLATELLKRVCNCVLKQEQIDAYQRFYKHYPIYKEVNL